jgi:glycosyltransferase involved in cell wall biosynthesis
MIIVDDGSTDNTKTVISNKLQDERIKYYYQENQGQSVARNAGIKKAVGDYICFLDSDNKFLPTKLMSNVISYQEIKNVDVIYGDTIRIDEQGKELTRRTMKKHSGLITKELLKDNFISMNTTMVKKTCFDEMGGFNENDRLAEDYELWLRLSTRYTFQHVGEVMAYYRVMDDQLSTDKDKRFWANEKIIKNFKKNYPQALSFSEWRRGFSFFYVRKSNYERTVKRYVLSLTNALRSIYYYPFWQGPWRSLTKLLLLSK